MESRRSEKLGTITTYGELLANKEVLRNYESMKAIIPPEDLPKNPIYLTLEGGGNKAIYGPFIQIKTYVTVQVPIDIRKTTIAEAYDDLRDIVGSEIAFTMQELETGVVGKLIKGQQEEEPTSGGEDIDALFDED